MSSMSKSWQGEITCSTVVRVRSVVRVRGTGTCPLILLLVTNKNSKYKCKKTKFIKDGYRRRSCTSKTAKIHCLVRSVMYCIITTCSVECYWHCIDETVHYKSNQTVNFCCFRCATTSPITVFYKLMFFTFICSNKHFQNVEGDTFKRQGHRQHFYWRHNILVSGLL